MKLYYIYADIDVPFMRKLLDLALALNGKKCALWQYTSIVYSVSDDENNNVTESCIESHEFRDILFKIKSFLIGVSELEKVTTYEHDEESFGAVESYKVESDLIEILLDNHAMLSDSLDSIAVYKEEGDVWIMGMIFHEKMTLLKDLSDAEIIILNESGIPYSEIPRDLW